MEIRNLITFVRIAEVQNFSKTAEQLGYSQSAVTMQIKQLENELQVPLFERIGKQARLTQADSRALRGNPGFHTESRKYCPGSGENSRKAAHWHM